MEKPRPSSTTAQPPARGASAPPAPPRILDRLLSDMGALPTDAPKAASTAGTPAPHPEAPAPLSRPDTAPPPAANSRKWLFALGLVFVIINLGLAVVVYMLLSERFAQGPVPEPPPPPMPPEEINYFNIPDPVVPEQDAALTEEAIADEPESPPPSEPIRLALSKLVLTRGTQGFGLYDPLPNVPLQPRHIPYLRVYTEYVHPQPEFRDDGRYVYQLTLYVKLYRADVGPTEPLMDAAASLIERGWSPRRDFHAAHPLQPIRRIEPGEHVLLVRLRDQNSGETAQEEITFFVHPE